MYRQPCLPHSKELPHTNMSTVVRLRNPGLCPPCPAPPPPPTPHHVNAHTHTHISCLGAPGWCHPGETHTGLWWDTVHVGESHHFRADHAPRCHCRCRLISCSGPSWDQRETSQQMGFHLVTVSVARSDYINSSSGSETHSCLVLCGPAFHLPRPKLIARQARREEFICSSVC